MSNRVSRYVVAAVAALGAAAGIWSVPIAAVVLVALGRTATLREALRTLAGEGLIDIRPSRGSVVRRLSPEDVASMLEVLAELELLKQFINIKVDDLLWCAVRVDPQGDGNQSLDEL